MNTQTVKTSKTLLKYLEIIASGRIEEGQIISMRSLMNKDKDAARAIFQALNNKELDLDASQQLKGLGFLLAQWKTPRGVERINNPFGYREQKVLESDAAITLAGFYDAANYDSHANYLPIYSVSNKDGLSFKYYYNGNVQIIG